MTVAVVAEEAEARGILVQIMSALMYLHEVGRSPFCQLLLPNVVLY